MSTRAWELFIDRGGTFTDCIARSPSGDISVLKVPSSDHAPLDGIRRLLGLAPDGPIPPCDIRMGTTLATNALLERRGHESVLFITRGFGDLLEIGAQSRPDLFSLRIEKPLPLAARVIEVDARHDAEGRVLCRADPSELLGLLPSLRGRSVAVVVLHAYRSPELEREIADVLAQGELRHLALSHQVAPELGLLARADTTLLDAYLTPVIADYVRALERELPGSKLRLMQSSGGLSEAAAFRGPAAILSGPAGGVVAVAEVATSAGVERAIGLDMGGTSTDVCRFAGEFEHVYETEVAGVRVRTPMLAIHTVAAGGGSICRTEGARLIVGPESAGSDPGPLAYGKPGSSALTLTDVNLVLGRLAEDRFPLPLDRARPEARLREIAALLRQAGIERAPLDLAEGFFRVANVAMAGAIRRVSIARGHDVRDHALIVFGGAGGQHACALARRLGIETILFHPLAGVMSAWGIGLADSTWHGERDAACVALEPTELGRLAAPFELLAERGQRELLRAGYELGEIGVERRVDLRYRGAESALSLALDTAPELERRFHREHARSFGHCREAHPIEVVAIRVGVRGRRRRWSSVPQTAEATAPPTPVRTTRVFHSGRFLNDVPVFLREDLLRGHSMAGPLLILESTGTLCIDPGFELSVGDGGLLRVVDRERDARPAEVGARGSERDPVLLEIMGNLYMSIAEQMGEALRRTAFSTNIRERLDFSCAVFDSEGGLVANAPHIPVHLGAMSESVRAVLRAHPEMQPGDVYVTNDPAEGGSHLPDITVVTPVHRGTELVFFTACRGHHADVGGITPGSMPAFSSSLAEEGVVLSNLLVVRGGHLDREGVLKALGRGPYPARDPAANLLDLEAQISANQTGVRLLGELVDRYGLGMVRDYMQHVQDDAAERVAREIARMPDGDHAFADALDDGTPIAVSLRVGGDRMTIDFAGTGPETADNLNAPRAVTLAAVLYFLRVLVGTAMPLNGGCLRNVEVRIPDGSVLSPSPGRAVAGGNVETSQRVVDVLLAAAGRAAASQGTMNNLSFGGDGFAYYETIAGGAGAGPDFDGASAVHTHMTNTRITDAEVLEARFPVRLHRMSVRRGTGGGGAHRGGDGVVREIELLAPAEVSLLSQRRLIPPFGLAGGSPGALGANTVDGRPVAGRARFFVEPGTRVRIETPGGGGYGTK